MKKQKTEEIISIDTPESLASEMYRELKRANVFKERIIIVLSCIIAALVCGIIGLSCYHIYMWSQFDTVVVDTGDGGGYANYVQGDNQGGIFNNGESSGQEAESEQGKIQGNADST